MSIERQSLISVTAGLVGLGLLMVYSSSITPWPSHADQKFLLRQFTFAVTGIVLACVAARLPVEFWRRAAYWLLGASIVLLMLVLVPGVGARVNGAWRWFRVGQASFQPSELAKFALVLALARAAESKREAIRRFWSGWLPLVLPGVLVSALVLIEPDFGTAMFVMAMTIAMLFLGGIPLWHMLIVLAAAAPAAFALVLMKPYRVERILQFVRAWSDPNEAPYQVQQSLIALGSGGFWGVGLGRSWQKLSFLPEANSDFVFAILGEELGLVGTLMVLALWGAFLFCGVRLARRVSDQPFAFLASFGLVIQLVFQAVFNIGVVTASLPPKGIALPFLSYGGSNLVMSLVSVGVVLGLTRRTDRVLIEEDIQTKHQ